MPEAENNTVADNVKNSNDSSGDSIIPTVNEPESTHTEASQFTQLCELGIYGGLLIEKYSSFTLDANNQSYSPESILYKSTDGLYGIKSADGLKDTGAIYSDAKLLIGDLYQVTTQPASTTVTGLNQYGIVDGSGKMIIPESYAIFEVKENRFLQALTITGTTDSDDYLLYASPSIFHVAGAMEGDMKFTGTWCLYDLQTGEKVPGADGSRPASFQTNGKYISYCDDNGEKVLIDNEGNPGPQYTRLFIDGSYTVEDETTGTYYTESGDVIFQYDPAVISPEHLSPYFSYIDGYIEACHKENGEFHYCIVDRQGAIVSVDFPESISHYGKLILSDDKVFNFRGERILDDVQSLSQCTKINTNFWCAHTKKGGDIFLDDDGRILLDASQDEGVNCVAGLLAKKDDKFFIFSQEDYLVSARVALGELFLSTERETGKCDVIEVLTGKTIIEGYKQYRLVVGDGFYRLYAFDDGGIVDAYKITWDIHEG